MDSRNFWIFSAIMILFLVWSHYFTDSPPKPADGGSKPAHSSPPPSSAPSPSGPAGPLHDVPTGQVRVDTPKYTAILDERGGRLVSFKLKDYNIRKLRKNLPDEKMELVAQPKPLDRPLRLTLYGADPPALLEEAPFLANVKTLNLSAGETGRLELTFDNQAGLIVNKILTFSADTYLVRQQVVFKSGLDWEGQLIHRFNSAPFQKDQGGRHGGLGAVVNRRLMTESAKDAPAELEKIKGQEVSWIGYMDQYFLTAMIPEKADSAGPQAFRAILQDHGGLALAESRPLRLVPGVQAVFHFDFYYGPKGKADLLSAGHALDLSVDMGWFAFIAGPLAALLRFIYGWVGNYGLAIIIVTILIKIVLWPLTAKSYRSMKEMQKLQPKVAKIREKYAGDREALNREIMRLYKTFKVNPLGGCLPMLLQIPFFIAFYQVLDSLLELRGAPFILWINDLAAPERLGSLNFTIPFFDPPTGLPVLTIMMGLSMFIQQKMTPNTMGDPLQAKIMMMMPLIFTFILINMPAGLVLYWLVNNILSIGQQTLINRPEKRETPAS